MPRWASRTWCPIRCRPCATSRCSRSHDMSAVAPPPVDVERVLALKTVREPTSRGHFLASIREYGRDGAEFTLERLQQLMRIEEDFQALLLYDPMHFLR